MKEVDVFYSRLYKTDNFKIPDDVSNSFLLSQPIPKLSKATNPQVMTALRLSPTMRFGKVLESFSWTVLIAHLIKANYQAPKNKE